MLAHFHGCTNAIGFILAAIVIVAERGVIANALAVFPSILERFVAVIAFIARVPAVLTTYLMARVPMTGLVTIVNICFVSMARMRISGSYPDPDVHIGVYPYADAELSVCGRCGECGCSA